MRLVKLYFTFGLLCLGFSSLGQQRTVFSTYMFNGLSINPAYAGSLNVFSATFTNRDQWVNIEGAPSYQSITAHTALSAKNIGVGLNAVRDVIGVHEQYSVYGSAVYRVRTNTGILSMGLQAGFDQRTSDFNKLDWFSPDDPHSAYTKTFNPNLGVGVYFSNRDYFLGASVPYLLTPPTVSIENVQSKGKASRYYYINGGFVRDLSPNVKINPSFMLRLQDNSPFAFDINANFIINEIIYAGLSYRYQDSYSLITQFVLNENFRIGYAYDIPASDLGVHTAGSHEIFVNYRILLKFNERDGLCSVYF